MSPPRKAISVPARDDSAQIRPLMIRRLISNPAKRACPYGTSEAALKTHEIQADFGVPVLHRPHVERRGGNLVHYGDGVAVDRHVHRFQIVLASIASFDAHGGEIFRRITRQLLIIHLAAKRTQNPPELPFGQAEGANKKTLSAIALGTQNRDLRLRAAYRTYRAGETLEPRTVCHGETFSKRLEQHAREERIWSCVIGIRRCQEIAQHLTLLFRRAPADLCGFLRQFRGAVLLDQREQGGQLSHRGINIESLTKRTITSRRGPRRNAVMKRLLKLQDSPVERENLGGAGITLGEIDSTLDALAPIRLLRLNHG